MLCYVSIISYFCMQKQELTMNTIKSILTAAILAGTLTTNGQALVSDNVYKDITTIAEVRNTRFARPSPAGQLRKAGKPVAFYIGDSTMRTLTSGDGWSGEWGFGLFAQQWFDPAELVVENHALGGTSSRTYYNYEWPTVKKGIRAGDYVVISFGHNDGGSNWTTKSTISGTSDTETLEVTNDKGVSETVYSYGQYLRMLVDETLNLGATPIICSRTPRGTFTNGQLTMDSNYRQWAKTIAQEKGVAFIDIEGVANPIYTKFGQWKTEQLYYNGTLHTSLLGAWHNAYCAALSIAANDDNPLRPYLLDTTPPTLTIERQPGRPYTFYVGGSDTSARGTLRCGHWSLVYNTLEAGDTVMLAFGQNELASITTDGELGCLQTDDEQREHRKMTSPARWEVVGSYGWYIHYFLNDIAEKGAVGVLVNDAENTPAQVIAWNNTLAQRHGALLRQMNAPQGNAGLSTPVTQMEKLTRGLVALPAATGGMFVSWRMMGTDPLTTTFDLLRNGKLIAADLANCTNYTDPLGAAKSRYQVVVKVDGLEVERTEAVSPWNNQYKVLQIDRPSDGIDDVTGLTYSYTPNDCAVGDVDGDGTYELILQWQPSNKTDNDNKGKHPGNEYIDCYRMDGEKLWRIDMGVNMLAGDHHTQMLVYDFDGNGRAELILRTAPGTKDGQGRYVSLAADDATISSVDNSIDWRAPYSEAITGGQEYLTVFEGATGKALHTIFYNPNRDTGYGGEATGLAFNWDDRKGKADYVATYGNRGNRFLAAVAYLDGNDQRPSAVMCRGYYTQAYLWAVDFDGQKLSHKWLHASVSKTEVQRTDANWQVTSRYYDSNTFGTSDSYTAYGQGNHNLSVADVDGDGCDEIIYGGATIDNDGWLLYTTGLGHGDALHVADIIPDRPGYEVYRCCESSPYGSEMHDARTGETIYHQTAGKDTGRCLAADVTDAFRGLEFWAGQGQSPRESATGNFDVFTTTMPSINFRIYWDGDLQDELFDGSLDTTTGIAHPNIMKWNGNAFDTFDAGFNNSQTCNWTKATPCLQADLLGDWREELVMWNLDDPSQLNIITTNAPSAYRVPTLMHDHNYRLAVAFQNVAYNQPPHLGYYLPDANFDHPDPAIGQTEPSLAGHQLKKAFCFDSLDNTYITIAYPDEPKGSAWEDGNKKQQTIYNVTTPAEWHDHLAFQSTWDGTNASKGWWVNSGSGGLVCQSAHRSGAVLGLKQGDIVVIEATNGVDGTLTITNGSGQPDGPFTYVKSSDGSKYYCTMTADGQVGFSGIRYYTGAIKSICIYTPITLGDVNADGQVDFADVNAIVSHILGMTPSDFSEKAADTDGNGSIDMADVTTLIGWLLAAKPA